ncbi:hypothetical protein Y032_0005g2433 [Ancylostoma ceylanicum]|uniref:Reverse transcriptase domain-containing protein n=1 Tax=Ancylostoma ceylanicum TaxID=53326 RepID=A0A016VSS9_9BILA|nr:hypothetical protein Y032_0005g2433 [Ancylostoma ceylanicum]
MPLCLTFIDLWKAFDSVETEAVLEALGNQGVSAQYTMIFRELYSNFTTRISPFYDDITIDVRRGVRQGDTVSPKLFTATLEDVMQRLEWDNMGVRVDGRLLHHLRFADDIVLITLNISQAECMLADFDNACGKIGLQLNLTETMFMRNGWVPDAPFSPKDHLRMLQLRISRSRSQHDERPRSRAGQEEASDLGSLQEHRGRRRRRRTPGSVPISPTPRFSLLWLTLRKPGHYVSSMRMRSASSNAPSRG